MSLLDTARNRSATEVLPADDMAALAAAAIESAIPWHERVNRGSTDEEDATALEPGDALHHTQSAPAKMAGSQKSIQLVPRGAAATALVSARARAWDECVSATNTPRVQRAFLEVFVSLLKGFRHCVEVSASPHDDDQSDAADTAAATAATTAVGASSPQPALQLLSAARQHSDSAPAAPSSSASPTATATAAAPIASAAVPPSPPPKSLRGTKAVDELFASAAARTWHSGSGGDDSDNNATNNNSSNHSDKLAAATEAHRFVLTPPPPSRERASRTPQLSRSSRLLGLSRAPGRRLLEPAPVSSTEPLDHESTVEHQAALKAFFEAVDPSEVGNIGRLWARLGVLAWSELEFR